MEKIFTQYSATIFQSFGFVLQLCSNGQGSNHNNKPNVF